MLLQQKQQFDVCIAAKCVHNNNDIIITCTCLNRNMYLEAAKVEMEELYEFRQRMELSAMESKTKRSEKHNIEV